MLEYFNSIGLNVWMGLLAMVGLFVGALMFNWVNKSIGIKFAMQLFMMTKKINKKKVLLKIWLPSGKPEYTIVDAAKRIEYKYKENKETKTGLVFYDHYAKYHEFNNIPVVECSPDDILPRNPFTKTSLTISPSIVRKNIIDSAKDTVADDNVKKIMKLALPIIIAVMVGAILYSNNQSEALAQCTSELIRIAANSKTATIIGG